MATMIQTEATVYYCADQPEEVLRAIEAGEFLVVWWFAAWGQRFTERAWFRPEFVSMVRTESDD